MRAPEFERKVCEAARDAMLWSTGDRLLVALSGGPDSVALLHALAALRTSEAIDVGALHVNYGLRKAEARGDADFCGRICTRLNVPLYIHEAAPPPQGNVQDWARRVRQDALKGCAQKHGYAHVALAHTADDRAETLMLQMFRGAGPDTLGHLLPAAGLFARPLLGLSRRDVLAYLAEARIPFRVDRSNYLPAYRRNRVRHELLKLAGDIFTVDAARALGGHAELLALDARYLDQQAEALYACAMHQGAERALAISDLVRFDPALQLRALRRLAAELGAHVNRAQSLRMLGLLGLPPGRRIPLDSGLTAERGRDHIWIYRPQAPEAEVPLSIPGEVALPDGTRLEVKPAAAPDAPFPDGRRRARIHLPEMAGWRLRTARAGDRMRPFGMTGRRLVFDVLAEAGVPRHLRSHSWVLTDGQEIYWLLGYRLAEPGRVGPDCRGVYEFRWSPAS